MATARALPPRSLLHSSSRPARRPERLPVRHAHAHLRATAATAANAATAATAATSRIALCAVLVPAGAAQQRYFRHARARGPRADGFQGQVRRAHLHQRRFAA
eukprot:2258053-Prymnesium_polylepis.1